MNQVDRKGVQTLAAVLADIEHYDTLRLYHQRNYAIYQACVFACDLGYGVGFRIDPNEPAWPVAFIELPTGQVSWHLPQHTLEWDEHTTADKYERIHAYQEFFRC